MFPGMGPLCTGQGQEKKKKKEEGQRRWRQAGVWELKKAKLCGYTFMLLYVKVFQLYNCKKKGCNSI